MKSLTEKQQQIIEQISNEFARINSATKPKGKFNLVDVSELDAINEEMAEDKRIAEENDRMWKEIAMQEARRIVELLKEDLPDWVYVATFSTENGHYECPSITIQKEVGCPHFRSAVQFNVKVQKRPMKFSHGISYDEGCGLYYEIYNHPHSSDKYNTLEDLFEKSEIKNQIRERILNN